VKPLAFASLALVVTLLLGNGTARTDDKPAVKFQGTADLPDAVQIVTGFSEDKQAATVIFRNNQVAVGAGSTSPVATRVTTVSLPFDVKDKEVKLTQDVRGYVSVQGKSRAVLMIQAAGKTTVVDLKESAVRSNQPQPEGTAKQAKDRAKALAKDFPAPDKGAKSYDFQTRIDATVAPGASYQITFVLLVEREAADGEPNALLAIDSLDVELKK
jgi:hypothetical protein